VARPRRRERLDTPAPRSRAACNERFSVLALADAACSPCCDRGDRPRIPRRAPSGVLSSAYVRPSRSRRQTAALTFRNWDRAPGRAPRFDANAYAHRSETRRRKNASRAPGSALGMLQIALGLRPPLHGLSPPTRAASTLGRRCGAPRRRDTARQDDGHDLGLLDGGLRYQSLLVLALTCRDYCKVWATTRSILRARARRRIARARLSSAPFTSGPEAHRALPASALADRETALGASSPSTIAPRVFRGGFARPLAVARRSASPHSPRDAAASSLSRVAHADAIFALSRVRARALSSTPPIRAENTRAPPEATSRLYVHLS
jgi:hypothetical protein